MNLRCAYVHRLPASAPEDVSALAQAIAAGRIDASGIVGILGKTEGNGCVNDFSRGLAARALHDELARHVGTAAAASVCLVMSGGTEGALSPHFLVLETRAATGEPTTGALAIGRAHTPPLPPEHLGRLPQVDMVAEGVAQAMADAGISSIEDVHFVQIKCPLLTAERIRAAHARGVTLATQDTLKSMGLSRGASALGCALALGEIARDAMCDEAICRDFSLHSARASASAGVELPGHEIIVLGTAPGWTGPLRSTGAVMRDAIDIEPVRSALARLGLGAPGQLDAAARRRVIALLAKAEASSSGQLRGHRHTMLDDSDIAASRHARGFVAGALAALIGHAEIYVSGGAEHQGPDGGGPVCIISTVEPDGDAA